MISIENLMGNALKAAGLGLLLGSGACLTTDPVDPNKQTVAVVSGQYISDTGIFNGFRVLSTLGNPASPQEIGRAHV